MSIVELSSICTMKYGKMLPKDMAIDEGFPVYSGYRVTGYSKEYLYKEPMLVIVARGVGGTGDVKISPPNAWITNLSIILALDDSKVDKFFLFYLLNRESLKEKLNSGAAQAQITIDSLLKYQIYLPRLEQQKKTAELILTYDNLIDNNHRRIQLLEESARLLYREWFVHLRFPGHEQVNIIDGVPEGWGKKQLAELCIDIRETVKPNVINPETPYIGLEHIPRKSITLVDWDSAEKVTSNKFLFQKFDIIFGKIRPYFHKVGFAICDGITSSDAIVIRALDEFYYQYLLMYLSSDYFVALASKTCKEGSKMPRADWKYLQSTDVLVPRDLLLEQFSKQINMIIGQLEALAKYNKSLIKARDLLLPKLISGELDI